MTLWQEVFLYILEIKQTEMVESERITICGRDKIRRRKKSNNEFQNIINNKLTQ